MARRTRTPKTDRLVRLAVAYDDANETPDFEIPEDLTALSDEELRDLHARAVDTFNELYNGGEGITDEILTTLAALTTGIEAIVGELSTRESAAAEREAAAAELAARANPAAPADDANAGDGDDDVEQPETDAADGPPAGDPPAPEVDAAAPEGDALAASARGPIRVNTSTLRSRQVPRATRTPAAAAERMQDVVLASADVAGFTVGQGVDWSQIGQIVDARLGQMPGAQQLSAMADAGQTVRNQFGVVAIRKPIPEELMIRDRSGDAVMEVLRRATDETRLPGGSLVASGGWCAPSEILYGNLLELESRDGLVQIPEVGVSRGGFQYTTGVDFWDIYNGTGFDYTEAQDIAGTYAAGNTVGDKPCYKVDCPDFTEVRLGVAGLCITAGLLQQKGYPEVIARTVRGGLVAHDHKMSARVINKMVTGSDTVTMTSGTVGTLAPLLTGIELQTEHYRYVHRMPRGTTLEAIFPFWIRGAIRSDLALRNGVNLVDVTDAQIDQWFRSRGIAPQYVYDWQAITGGAGAFTGWPGTVKFLLYAAGTWVKGGSELITVDTMYDSALLRQNDFIALFTEESYLVAKMGIDSRVVEVPVCASGSTGLGQVLTCTGTAATTNDVTVPVAGTAAVSSRTSTGFTVTVTGASDAGVGLNDEPYRFSTDGGVTWSEWQASNGKAVTGLTTATNYVVRHQVRDKAGNSVYGQAVATSTT